MAARDFEFEAREMVLALASKNKGLGPPDDELIKHTAEVLELSFRRVAARNRVGSPIFQQCSVQDRDREVGPFRFGGAGGGVCCEGWHQVSGDCPCGQGKKWLAYRHDAVGQV